MKNLSRHQGRLVGIHRLKSSANGNPRFAAYCGGVNFVTAVDSQLAYHLSRHEGKMCEVTVGTHYGRTTLDDIRCLED